MSEGEGDEHLRSHQQVAREEQVAEVEEQVQHGGPRAFGEDAAETVDQIEPGLALEIRPSGLAPRRPTRF